MYRTLVLISLGMGIAALIMMAAEGESVMMERVPEDVYEGELVRYPGAWQFQLGRTSIILVTDDELETLASDPDAVLDLSLTLDKREASLRQVCEDAQARGVPTLIIAFDHFFSQYRPGLEEGATRRLMPDMDEYVEHIARISQFAGQYGLRLELSLLSPLEIGPAYQQTTGESGVWMHYRKGLRDPETGAFSVQLWQQRRWANNKGPLNIEDAGVRVFAFRETPVDRLPYRVVHPEDIVEVTDVAQVEVWDNKIEQQGDYRARRIRVHGVGMPDIGPLDRVFVVQHYRVPEMDYFSEQALPYLKGLVDQYADAGIELNGLYSDEMHIQQDWHYFSHHDHGEFALRYVSDGLQKRFAEAYGEQYRDFAKYLIYFVYGQEDFANDLSAKAPVSHVFGSTPEAIRETALFRARYYRMLQDGVVDLFTEAKHYAEQRFGRRLEARAHATWAESPTIDRWDTRGQHHAAHQYEYTSNFVWSCTVHQAASACYDYFKWGDFLTGGGNDHAEGGWLDRNYLGLTLACSLGIINEVPYAYAAHWGMPAEISHRRMALVNAYGAAGSPLFGLVQDMEHRDVDVLMLYPIDLVAVEERFGSWMTQYGYANLITAAKLLEEGTVVDGAIELGGRRFTTLATMFEPFPSEQLLDMLEVFVSSGGTLIWSGPPPVVTWEGGDALGSWQKLFGISYTPPLDVGYIAPGRQVDFTGSLGAVAPQVILTDFLPDRVYPVTPDSDTETVAKVRDWVVGTRRNVGSGKAVYLGYRPRDDQAQSLGYDVRNWFEVLDEVGSYPATGAFEGFNDNTERLSRIGDVLATRFPNGAMAYAPHLRLYEETWPGGFGRNREQDQAILEGHPPPDDTLALDEFRANGRTVSYRGVGAMSFRTSPEGDLIAFAGGQSREITIDGRTFVFADDPIGQLAWAPVPPERSVDGRTVLKGIVHGRGVVRIPLAGHPEGIQLVSRGAAPGSKGDPIPSHVEDGHLVFEVTEAVADRWFYGVLSE